MGAQIGVAKCDRAFASPQLVTTLEGQQITNFSGGELHTIACTEFGDVFAWGRGKEGQLGHGDGPAPAQQWVPRRIEGLVEETVVDVCAGAFHSLAVTTTGKVFQWGLVHVSEEMKRAGDAESDGDAEVDPNEAAASFAAQVSGGAGFVEEDANERRRRVVEASERQYLSCGDQVVHPS